MLEGCECGGGNCIVFYFGVVGGGFVWLVGLM